MTRRRSFLQPAFGPLEGAAKALEIIEWLGAGGKYDDDEGQLGHHWRMSREDSR